MTSWAFKTWTRLEIVDRERLRDREQASLTAKAHKNNTKKAATAELYANLRMVILLFKTGRPRKGMDKLSQGRPGIDKGLGGLGLTLQKTKTIARVASATCLRATCPAQSRQLEPSTREPNPPPLGTDGDCFCYLSKAVDRA